MRRLFLFVALTFSAAAFAQETAAAAPGTPARPELDVSKLPFSPDSIKQVITHHLDQVQACYEESLSGKSKAVGGKLMTQFVITPEGMVKGAKVSPKGTTLKDARLHQCVVATLTAMSFPKPSDGRDQPVEYPFNLKPVE